MFCWFDGWIVCCSLVARGVLLGFSIFVCGVVSIFGDFDLGFLYGLC